MSLQYINLSLQCFVALKPNLNKFKLNEFLLVLIDRELDISTNVDIMVMIYCNYVHHL